MSSLVGLMSSCQFRWMVTVVSFQMGGPPNRLFKAMSLSRRECARREINRDFG
jgi:hypothetical protein